MIKFIKELFSYKKKINISLPPELINYISDFLQPFQKKELILLSKKITIRCFQCYSKLSSNKFFCNNKNCQLYNKILCCNNLNKIDKNNFNFLTFHKKNCFYRKKYSFKICNICRGSNKSYRIDELKYTKFGGYTFSITEHESLFPNQNKKYFVLRHNLSGSTSYKWYLSWPKMSKHKKIRNYIYDKAFNIFWYNCNIYRTIFFK